MSWRGRITWPTLSNMNKRKNLQPANASESKPETTYKDRLGLERLIFFSDCVFAIAITLLVLDVKIPVGAESFNNDQLLASLLGIWHKYLAYLISFLVIGSYWISHHRKFRMIERYDNGLLLINLLLLMTIGFIPFPSAVISINGNRTATIFYAGVMALNGLLVALLWWHAARHNHLIDARVDKRRRWREAVGPLANVAVFLLSIGFAFIDENVARTCWLLLLPTSLIITARR
jgi:uncharacterized membrane protein